MLIAEATMSTKYLTESTNPKSYILNLESAKNSIGKMYFDICKSKVQKHFRTFRDKNN